MTFKALKRTLLKEVGYGPVWKRNSHTLVVAYWARQARKPKQFFSLQNKGLVLLPAGVVNNKENKQESVVL